MVRVPLSDTGVRAIESGMGTSLTFAGAAGTVTGSSFLLERDGRRLLVDCGLYQGERHWRRMNWRPPTYDPSSIEDIVVTHAHLDHIGRVPALTRDGFEGPVWCTEGTSRLGAIVLRDSAYLQEQQAESARVGGWSKHDPPLPLYTARDAEQVIRQMRTLDYDTPQTLDSGAVLTLTRAGHILGSACALVELGGARVLFSGDLGRTTHPLLLPRQPPPAARTVVLESTYGDRTHEQPDPPHEVMAETIRTTIARGGSVLVPAFAIDRTELVLRVLDQLTREGRIPPVPVWVDSPMALAAWEVYRATDLRHELRADLPPRLVSTIDLRRAHSAQESTRLNTPAEPCIIVSASGMATGGRVVHHLQALLPDHRHAVVLTGYQGVGTRGRSLADGATELKMFGRYVPVRADVVVDAEFSVHADADDLLAWLRELPAPPEEVYVVHGEDDSRRALADRIRAETGWLALVPRLGEKVRVD